MQKNLNKFVLLVLILILSGCCISAEPAEEPKTNIGEGGGKYHELFNALKKQLKQTVRTRKVQGRKRTVFVRWIRDHVHVMKAMKYLEPDLTSYLEFFLENQTSEGLYYDYYYPIDADINHRMNLFDHRYWHIDAAESIQMYRLPVEVDLEYLMVKGADHVWRATGDRAFLKQWLPSLEDGLKYMMDDPLRWSRKYQLVKRGYTLDTWDFMDLPTSREAFRRKGGDVQEAIFDIDRNTPMGIMHGDNSGMYAACRQLARMHEALGRETEAKEWRLQARQFRLRTNRICWNGDHYAHFVEDDPVPSYYDEEYTNALSLSNPYDINRGLPTEEMARSIIRTYRDLRDDPDVDSFAEWFGVYPPVQPDFAGYEPGSYMNGGVNTIVAGELAKAAFQHGFESYGVDILNRILELVRKHDGDLPVAYRPDGTVDEGIPDSWGQAAVFSALIEGLAGVVDQNTTFQSVTIAPRWMAAGVDSVDVTVTYPSSKRSVQYGYRHDEENHTIQLSLSGDPSSVTVKLLLPEQVSKAQAKVDGQQRKTSVKQVRNRHYAVVQVDGNAHVTVSYSRSDNE